ncbi:MAG: leucyl/phenylalanyl-tRNA--protein transferase [Pirellulaceae bacterium]
MVSRFFPPASSADRDGLVAIDPRFDSERMLDAYQHGIFPWPCRWGDRWVDGWYSPDPRAILPFETFRISRRLRRKLRAGHFLFQWDSCFETVLKACASVDNREAEAWLSPRLRGAIVELHRQGHAHSIEVFDASGELCGGLYGIAAGAAFAAESMFHLKSDASKAAICALVKLLEKAGFQLLDVQQASSHLLTLGAVELPRSDYLKALTRAVEQRPMWPRGPKNAILYDQIGSEANCDP